MGKRLLTSEYAKIVLEGLLLPEKDVFNYYANNVETNYLSNPEMLTEFKNALNEWIEWYKKQVHGGKVPVKMEDGTTKWFDKNQTWETDNEGNITWHDLEEDKIWLLPLLSEKNVRVNKAFFENHIKIIDVFCVAENTFNGFWEILTENFYSIVAQSISTKKIEMQYIFIKECTNDQYDNVLNKWEENQTKAINDLIKKFHYAELEKWSNIPHSPKKLIIINEAITLFKKQQVIHTLKNDGEDSLGSRLIDSRIKYLEILKTEMEQKLKTLNTKEISKLQTNLTDTQRALLFDLLEEEGFILNENKDCFIWALGGNVKPEKFTPIKWIKTNSLTKGKNLSKVSILNLLHILKVKESQIINKFLLNNLFAKPDGTSIKFTGSNYTNGYISEYNKILTDIVNKLQ